MGEWLIGLGIAWVVYKLVSKSEEAPPPPTDRGTLEGSAGVTQTDGPGYNDSNCNWQPLEFSDVWEIVGFVNGRPGSKLGQKISSMANHGIGVVNARRIAKGAIPVERRWRDQDTSQTGRVWVANLAYWYAYPLAPIKIPSATGNCADTWKRVYKIVDDAFTSYGL